MPAGEESCEGGERAGARKAAGAFGVGDSKSRHFGAGRALTQAYLGVYVFAPRHAGAWLAAGSEEVSLGCDLRELRKEDLVLYRGEKALAGGGGWEGASWLSASGLFCSQLAGTCSAPGLGTSPRFWQQRAGSARGELRACEKAFISARLFGQIF